MTQSIEIKCTVLSEKFNEKFADLVMKPGNLKSVFCSTYKNESGVYLSDYMDLFKRSKVDIVKYIDLSESIFKKLFFRFNVKDGLNSYLFDISIYLNSEIFLHIVDNNGNTSDSYILRFHEKAFYSFFSQTEEESTSEPKHPEEDAEEQSEMIDTNIGAMPIEDYREIRAIQYGFDSYEDFRKAGYYLNIDKPNISEPNPQAEENKQGVELTPLERNLFEQYYKASDKYDEYIALSDNGNNSEYSDYAIFELLKCDLLIDLINHNGLYGMYTAWLIERQKQEALTVL